MSVASSSDVWWLAEDDAAVFVVAVSLVVDGLAAAVEYERLFHALGGLEVLVAVFAGDGLLRGVVRGVVR